MTLSVVHAMYTIASTQRSKIVFRETEHRAAGAAGGAARFGSVRFTVASPYRVFLLLSTSRVAPDDYSPLSLDVSLLSYKYRIATSKSSHSDRMEARTHGMRSPGEEEHDP